jgi:hypothetical protein
LKIMAQWMSVKHTHRDDTGCVAAKVGKDPAFLIGMRLCFDIAGGDGDFQKRFQVADPIRGALQFFQLNPLPWWRRAVL